MHLFGESVKRQLSSAILFGSLESANNVLKSGSHHKILLLQTQLLPLKELQNTEVWDVC